MLTGQCHCGNISFSVPEKPDTLTECNCSMCHRYGSRWAYYKPADVTVTVKTTPTETYQWGDKMIDFHHCSNCGCLTHYTSTDPSSDRLAINTRMCSLENTKDIPIRLFDGADTWKFLN